MIFNSNVVTAALLFISCASQVSAQTTANCNPLKATCPADPGLGTSISIDFTQGKSSRINAVYNEDEVTYNAGTGMQLQINKLGDAPTVASDFYIFFGKVEVVAQAAAGTGIISSVVLISDDNDEIDIEWTGGDSYHVQTNYFSKGDVTTYDRGGMTDLLNAQSSFHTYAIDWTSESIVWYVDGAAVRTLTPATSEGYPQTPMQIKIGSWVGGDPANAPGTIAWAGGLTDFSQAPFNFYLQSLKVTDYSSGKEYSYGDNSGSSDSIIVSDVTSDDSGASSSIVATSELPASSETVEATSTSAVVSTTEVASTSSTVDPPTSTIDPTTSTIDPTTSTTSSTLTSTTSSTTPVTTSTTSSELPTSSTVASSTIFSSASETEVRIKSEIKSSTKILASSSARPTTLSTLASSSSSTFVAKPFSTKATTSSKTKTSKSATLRSSTAIKPSATSSDLARSSSSTHTSTSVSPKPSSSAISKSSETSELSSVRGSVTTSATRETSFLTSVTSSVRSTKTSTLKSSASATLTTPNIAVNTNAAAGSTGSKGMIGIVAGVIGLMIMT